MSLCNRKGPRVSALPTLARCPGFHVAREVTGDSAGAAAHTGSAVGRVIELWHRLGEHGGCFEEAMRTAMSPHEVEAGTYHLADWDAVKHWALLYAQDPRNRGVVVPELQEAEVKLTLDPDPDDPTGEPVELVGHVDQIRRTDRGYAVWDLKAGRAQGESMVYGYALQLAAYALACTETLGETVLPGGIIRLRGYDSKRAKEPDAFRVFFDTPWSLEACRALLGTVAYTVGELRRGVVRIQPGDQCRYCPGGGPGECWRLIDEALA